jgi:hypothetical protein
MPARGSARRNLCPRPKHNHLRVRQCDSRWVESPGTQNRLPPLNRGGHVHTTRKTPRNSSESLVIPRSASVLRRGLVTGTPLPAWDGLKGSVRAPSLRTTSPRRAISTSLDPRCVALRPQWDGMVSCNLTPACLRSLSISAVQESTRAHAHTQRELADIIERACPKSPALSQTMHAIVSRDTPKPRVPTSRCTHQEVEEVEVEPSSVKSGRRWRREATVGHGVAGGRQVRLAHVAAGGEQRLVHALEAAHVSARSLTLLVSPQRDAGGRG